MARPKDHEEHSEYERGRRDGISAANQSWLMKVVWYIVGVIGAAIYFVIDFLRKGS